MSIEAIGLLDEKIDLLDGIHYKSVVFVSVISTIVGILLLLVILIAAFNVCIKFQKESRKNRKVIIYFYNTY